MLAGGSGSDDLSSESFAATARIRFGPVDQAVSGDYSINPDLYEQLDRVAKTPAAVLVPVVRGSAGRVLLTIRTDNLPSHPGQIAFPGGKIDPGDADAPAAALREATEEIGLAAGDVDIIGRIPDYLTGSGYRISPVVALVPADYPYVINRNEVREVFDVPLGLVMDLNNYQVGQTTWNGAMRRFYEISHGDRRIWGITAGILRVLAEQVYGTKERAGA